MNIGEKTLSCTIDGLTAWVTPRDYDLLLTIFAGVTDHDDCWEAAGPRNKNSGYVHLYRGSNAYRIGYVHRFVCHLYKGLPLDYTTHECHHLCGNRVCCRPTHLTALTVEDHKAQTRADDRYARGDKASFSILTEAQVIEYRLRYAAGETCPDLAEEAGVQRATLWNALHGVHFAHVPGAVERNNRRDNRGEKHHKSRLKESDIPTIYTAYWVGGMSTYQLGRVYGVSDEAIRGIINGTAWNHVKRPVINRQEVA